MTATALAPGRRTRRALVTGSRSWPWPRIVHRGLDEQRALLPPDGLLTVVVGFDPDRGTPAGVDRFAYEWALHHQRTPDPALCAVIPETHPADWDTCGPGCVLGDAAHRRATTEGRLRYCPRAGHRRNQEMVDAGADVVLAFVLDDSPGATDCLGRARRARLNHIARHAYTRP